MSYNRIVVKVGTSTLTYPNGSFNLRHIELLCKVLSDLQNSGKEIILVSSGAVGVGMGKMKFKTKPVEIEKRQALAAIGQSELMFIYDKIFGEYNHTVAQVLLSADSIEKKRTKNNVKNTFFTLLDFGAIPIVNENDTVAVDELEGQNFGDNDMLSAIVSGLVKADLLVILSDIDGLYTSNPLKNKDAVKIDIVTEINDKILKYAGGSETKCGTGGMITKLSAAKYVTEKNIDCCIMNGENPQRIYDLLEGKSIGTIFKSKKKGTKND